MVAVTNLNLAGVEPSVGVTVTILPEGWHKAMIQLTKSVAAKENERNSVLEVHFTYQDGSTFVNRYNLWNDNEDATRIAKQEMAALALACGVDPRTMQDTAQLHNAYVDMYLSVETAEYPKNSGKKITVNRLKALKMRDGKVMGTVPPSSGAAAGGAPAGGFSPPAVPATGGPAQGGFAAPAAGPQPGPAQGGFAPPAGPGPQQGGFAPPANGPGAPYPANGPGAPYPAASAQGNAPQPWGQGQGPQPGPAQSGFAPAAGPQPGPAQGGFAPPAAGGFTPPAGAGGWGGPQG